MSGLAESAVTLSHETEQLGLCSPVRSALSTSKPHWVIVTRRPGKSPLAYFTCKHRSSSRTGTHTLQDCDSSSRTTALPLSAMLAGV
jgi:hypothetical protein